jgi:hypothetical protein
LTGTNQLTLADKATRALAVATVSGLAALAARISYRHMLLLAERSHEYGLDAHAFPLTVDGLDLIGVLVLLADRRTARRSGWLPWTVLTIGSLASIAANIAVAPNNPVARAISGWSAITVLAAAKMLAHLFEPTQSADNPAQDTAEQAAPGSTPTPTPASGPNDSPRDTVDVRGHQRRRVPGDAARRIPTSHAAKAKWTAIWQAIQHLDTATPEAAATHGVSLRTLQFIRAAGQEGHLQPPDLPPHPQATAAAGGPLPADGDPAAQPNRHGSLTGATT